MRSDGVSSKNDITTREKSILSGLYLSKYDDIGLRELGFDSFVEAFNVIGFALGIKPRSIKNYRDEFDPLFPNQRMGWHKRKTRDYCMAILNEYAGLDFESFTGLVRSFFGYNEAIESALGPELPVDGSSAFAQRLITGLAAEHYFESIHSDVAQFKGLSIENTTRFGCGYDYRLYSEPRGENFVAVEVKGLRGKSGTVSMTPKEYDVASLLRDRFYLFVVRNFRESPFHQIFQNPLSSGLEFCKSERTVVQVSWLATLS